MTVFVSLTPAEGDIVRYFAPGRAAPLWKTHAASAGGRVLFRQSVCDEFRYRPPERFRAATVPPPRPFPRGTPPGKDAA